MMGGSLCTVNPGGLPVIESNSRGNDWAGSLERRSARRPRVRRTVDRSGASAAPREPDLDPSPISGVIDGTCTGTEANHPTPGRGPCPSSTQQHPAASCPQVLPAGREPPKSGVELDSGEENRLRPIDQSAT